MKINLNGIFKDIKRIVDAPVKPDVKAPAEYPFEKILASVSPRRGDYLKAFQEDKPLKEVNKAVTSEAMARIAFDLPNPEMPEIHPVQVVTEPQPAESGVKTPTLLEARRLSTDAFTVLRKPEKISAVNELARQYGAEHGVDPMLSLAIIQNESNFETTAVSSDGHFSKGLMQLLDSTGSQYHEQIGLREKYDPFDPDQNVKLGVGYLRYLHDIFSKPTALPNEQSTVVAANSSSLEKLAVAAFNAGEGRVASAQARARQAGLDSSHYDQIETFLPESTQKYVKRVMRSRDDFALKTEG